jgi:hypothetical protein
MFLRMGASPNINIHRTPRFCDFLGAHVTSFALTNDTCYQRDSSRSRIIFGLCPESAVPHSSLLIVILKNSAEGEGSVSPCQAKDRGKNAATCAVITIYDAPY